MITPTRDARRARLREARLLAVFTPRLALGDPLEALAEALPWLGVVQVRIEHPEDASWPAPAGEALDWTRAVLEVVRAQGDDAPLVLVNDRVDVAARLEAEGVAGVHVGHRDTPPRIARRILSPDAVVGLSTHSAAEVARASVLPELDYLGFGPIHPTKTKAYARGLGCEAAWIAQAGSALPLFPIGGIDRTNAGDLAELGRAAVGAALLGAADPGAAARELYDLLARETNIASP